MPEQHHNARLNDVLIRIHRCLLQYVGECWPWSDADNVAREQSAIFSLVEEQREEVHSLVDLLDERAWSVDFGTYPTDFTDLHYISLGYLFDLLIADQKELIDDAESALTDCTDDSVGSDLLGHICSRMRNRLDQLNASAATRTATESS